MNFLLNGIFKGNSNLCDDPLPCPFCQSLKIKYVENTDYYTQRYQCKICKRFFRYDRRPVEQGIVDFRASEKLKFNIPNVAPADPNGPRIIVP